MLPKGRAAKATQGRERRHHTGDRAQGWEEDMREDECRGNTVDVEVVELDDGVDEAGRDSTPHSLWRAAVGRWLGRASGAGEAPLSASLHLLGVDAARLRVR
jgi:hypothetical protein